MKWTNTIFMAIWIKWIWRCQFLANNFFAFSLTFIQFVKYMHLDGSHQLCNIFFALIKSLNNSWVVKRNGGKCKRTICRNPISSNKALRINRFEWGFFCLSFHRIWLLVSKHLVGYYILFEFYSFVSSSQSFTFFYKACKTIYLELNRVSSSHK